VRRATPASSAMRTQAARGQARPSSLLVVQVAATVTPFRHSADSTVLDMRRQCCAAFSAACLGGDVGCTHEIAVRLVLAMRAAKALGAWLGDPTPAHHARGRGASLIDEPHVDAGDFRLVEEGLHQVGAAPLAQSQVLHPADILARDAPEITDCEDANPLLDGECDHFPGRLVVRWRTRRRWRASVLRSLSR
jgi:hypothetical protein